MIHPAFAVIAFFAGVVAMGLVFLYNPKIISSKEAWHIKTVTYQGEHFHLCAEVFVSNDDKVRFVVTYEKHCPVNTVLVSN